MEIKEIRQKPKEESEKTLKDLREKLRSLRFDLVAGKVKNVREIRQIKKDIARILTILKEHPTSEGGRGNPSVSPSRKRLISRAARNIA